MLAAPHGLAKPEIPNSASELGVQVVYLLPQGSLAHTTDGHLSSSGYFYFSFPILLTLLAQSKEESRRKASKLEARKRLSTHLLQLQAEEKTVNSSISECQGGAIKEAWK